MGLNYLNLLTYHRNSTYPVIYWYRGTAFQLEPHKASSEVLTVHSELGAIMVILTMAARIMQSMASIANKMMSKRLCYWKLLPAFVLRQVLKQLLCIYWSVLGVLLTLKMTNDIFYKSSKNRFLCSTNVNTCMTPIKCHCSFLAAETSEYTSLEERAFEENNMEPLDEVKHLALESHNMERRQSEESLLLDCKSPVILSVCLPLNNNTQSKSEDSKESRDSEEDFLFIKDMSTDSGMQECWTPISKSETDCGESDWSEDSWDSEDDSDYSQENEDLWESFCQNNDPYNPLNFAMPTKSPKNSVERKITKIECSEKNLDACQEISSWPSFSENYDLDKISRVKSTPRKPILSSSFSTLPTHKCVITCKDKDEPEEKYTEKSNNLRSECTKRVSFSSTVVVHSMVAWDYAYRKARKGPWEEYARDRCRFQRRIAESQASISYCLEPLHRAKVWKKLHSKKNE
ncbi:uncharacterized protein LOC128644551 [Bombina bombina]|uniref:uncharacterized protein LOC128644551 n=1 Tax=Bombina bombina TaxID=8345 RepID=UPI00235A57CF|nr:uncharacterized protein LOC128644551 [Bombina bombina]